MAYFERIDGERFLATEQVGGAWRLEEQHIAPALGLLAHLVEVDRDQRRDDGLMLARLSYDILGTMSVGEVSTSVRLLRPGRTIELVEATMSQGSRSAVILRAWLMEQRDTSALAASPLPSIPGPSEMAEWTPGKVWPGGFISTAQVRRDQVEPGRAAFWVRSDVPLLEGESVGAVPHAARLLDIANGMTVRVDPMTVHFPNLDLTADYFREPRGDWVGFDTSVSFGPNGVGLTSSVLHDESGPVGTLNQLLTVRPR